MKKGSVASALVLGFLMSVLVSCENFLSGSNLVSDLEKRIDYANSPAVSVRIIGDESAVKFISGAGECSLKKHDKRTVEFEVDSLNYDFLNWSAHLKHNKNVDCSSKVNVKTVHSENRYVSEIELLDSSMDIVLEVNCYRLPAVESISPAYYPSGVSCFQNIVVKFTQPMRGSELSDFSNVSITDLAGNSLDGYFDSPELSADGKTLVIRPIPNRIEKLVQNETVSVKVTLSSSLTEASSKPRSFKKFSYLYVITDVNDSIPPVLDEESLRLERKLKNLQTGEYYKADMDDLAYESWTDENQGFDKHLVNNSFFITAKGSDIGNGVKSFLIKETLVALPDGSSYGGSDSMSFECGSFMQSKKNVEVYSCDSFEYQIQSKDGIVKLDVSIVDYSGLQSQKKTFYVIKHSESSGDYFLESDDRSNSAFNQLRLPDSNGKFDYPLFRFKFSDRFYGKENNGRYSNSKITISYWDEGKKPTVAETIFGSKGKEYYEPLRKSIPLDSKVDSYIKYVLETDVGLTMEKQVLIPKSIDPPSISCSKKNGMNYLSFENVSLNGNLVRLAMFSKTAESEEYQPWKCFDIVYWNNSEFSIDLPESGCKYIKLYAITGWQNAFLYDENGSGRTYFVFSGAGNSVEFKIDSNGKIEGVNKNSATNPKVLPLYTAEAQSKGPNSGLYEVKLAYSRKGDVYHKYKVFCYYQVMSNAFGKNSLVSHYIYPEVDSNGKFSLPCGYTYQFGIMEVDDNGLDRGKTTSGYPKLDLTKNNAPLDNSLILKVEENGYAPNSFDLTIHLRNSDQQETLKGKTLSVDYYLSVNEITDLDDAGFPSAEALAELMSGRSSIKIPENPKNNMVRKPVFFDYVYDGGCVVYVKVSDSNGNYITGVYKTNTSVIKRKNEIDMSEYKVEIHSNQGLIWHLLNFPSDMKGSTSSIPYDKKYENEWIDVEKTTGSVYQGKVTFYLGLTDSEFNDNRQSFWRASVSFNESNVDKYYYSYFICPDYFFDSSLTYKKNPIKKKQIIEGLCGYSISTDHPALVRTLYSRRNFGDDADLWATVGLESDVKVIAEDAVYEPVKTGVPSGCYYCVVVTFADNSTYMGKVLRKN